LLWAIVAVASIDGWEAWAIFFNCKKKELSMKIKSILLITIAATFLAGCASTQMQIVDGKQREVFVSVAGTYSKDGSTIDEFNSVSRPCQQKAIDTQTPIYPGYLIPFNYGEKTKFYNAVIEQSEACIEAAGYVLVSRSKTHSSMVGK
jgi:hypothetical protein